MGIKLSKMPGYYKFNKQYKYVYYYILKYNININPQENFLIFSDPRGGSTWLMELIKEITRKPILWEPLNLSKGRYFSKLGFGWRQYIPESEEWYEAKQMFNKLFKGKLLNDWIIRETTINELKQTDQLIVKFCRGNALLPYLVKQFDFKHKPILMLRHPFAVVASQIKQGSWSKSTNFFQIPKTVFNSHYIKHQDYLKTLVTKEEVLVANWCITNLIPLNHENNNKEWITINYETLLLNPKKTIKRILKSWEIDFDVYKLNFRKESSTTISGSPLEVEKRLTYWKHQFNPEQINKMRKVLNYFEIKCYDESPKPLIAYN